MLTTFRNKYKVCFVNKNPHQGALMYTYRISIRDLARDITEEGASDGYAMPDEGEIMDDLESIKREQEEEF